MSSERLPERRKILEDPLEYLPVLTVREFRKGQTIYNHDQPATGLYLVMSGKVKVSRRAEDGTEAVIDIYKREEFFGESALAGEGRHGEFAVAFEKDTKLMTWTIAEVEEIVTRRPQLGIALLQLIVNRSLEFHRRIQSFSMDKIDARLARALIRFSERFGTRTGDNHVQMIPFTHELLARFVGTSREIVTHQMNIFRRQGHLSYSRKEFILDPEAMKTAVMPAFSLAEGETAPEKGRGVTSSGSPEQN